MCKEENVRRIKVLGLLAGVLFIGCGDDGEAHYSFDTPVVQGHYSTSEEDPLGCCETQGGIKAGSVAGYSCNSTTNMVVCASGQDSLNCEC